MQSAGDLVSETLMGSNPAFSRGRKFISFRFEHACLCQSIEINNNRHVYRQSQERMPNGCGVEWDECSLIIGTGCRFQVFSLILDSSVGLSAGIHFAGDLVSETLIGSNPAFSRGRQLVSFRFEYRLPVPEHRNEQQQTCILPDGAGLWLMSMTTVSGLSFAAAKQAHQLIIINTNNAA